MDLPTTTLEQTHVHAVYNLIADHFSATRYKPWPVVDDFLRGLPPASVGADIGCGNGKYLGVNPNVFTIGSDRSDKLIGICKDRGFEAMVCDTLSVPYRDGCFDFVLSIAVIHHLSSPDRRRAAIKELLRVVKPGGRVLVFVWALEQQGRRKFTEQDVFVPWHLPKHRKPGGGTQQDAGAGAGAAVDGQTDSGGTTPVTASDTGDVVYQRYYHLFVKGELDELFRDAGCVREMISGYDRDNWYVIATKAG
ncbi:tRNA methyltransferase, has a role in tRNA modification [Borealophlyctis nickersoniae]|nr:tRNA methyltransferase, has a role in tRNA modification [Borealophlyctis nickersoniae]